MRIRSRLKTMARWGCHELARIYADEGGFIDPLTISIALGAIGLGTQLFGGKKQKTTQTTQFPPELQPLFEAQGNLFGGSLLPLDVARTMNLALTAGGTPPPGVVNPLTTALRLAGSTSAGATQNIPGAGRPLTLDFATLLRQALARLPMQAAQEIAQGDLSLLGPQIAALIQPRTVQSTSGGPSGLGQFAGALGQMGAFLGPALAAA